MNRSRIIKELKSTRRLKASCPHCQEEFPLSKAIMFDAASDPPDVAVELIESRRQEFKDRAIDIREEEAELKRRKHSATDGAEKKAMEVGLGLVLEKVVTGWKEFPHEAHDCRSLFEPIDYVAFDGMTDHQKIEQIAFLDVKSGAARLNKHQRLIRDAVRNGSVDYKEV